jgi:hypoxanthine phosphoribosyltransferase
MSRSGMRVKGLRELYAASVIEERVRVIAGEIDRLYEGKSLVMICVLKGAFMFVSYLAKHVTVGTEIDFVRLASYGKGDSSSGTVSFLKDAEISLRNKDVLIVEEVVDSGLTMEFLVRQLEARGVNSLRIAALIDKVERRERSVTVDFSGFTLSSGFIVGYGLDYAERFRELPAVYTLEFEE